MRTSAVKIGLSGLVGLVSLAACGSFERACLGVGLPESACTEALAPAPGPWRAQLNFSADTCGLNDGTLGDGWAFAGESEALTLTHPFGGGAICTPGAEGEFACEGESEAEALVVRLALTAESRSSATGQLVVNAAPNVDAQCESVAEVVLWATWRDSQIAGMEEGVTCPRDYDRYDYPEVAEPATVMLRNRAGVDIGIFSVANGGVVYSTASLAGSDLEFGAAIGEYIVLADGWDVEECRHMFRVNAAYHEEVWTGE